MLSLHDSLTPANLHTLNIGHVKQTWDNWTLPECFCIYYIRDLYLILTHAFNSDARPILKRNKVTLYGVQHAK